MIEILVDILKLFLFSFITNYLYFSLGLIALSKFKLDNKTNTDISIDNFFIFIFGFIIISVLALFLNFFIPLTEKTNSIIYILIFVFSITNFRNKLFYKENIKFTLIVSLITSFLLIYSDVNRPDAYLYHLPYTAILNINEIIVGLSNIHFRYGHVSILQYTSAINLNFIFKNQGILIPSASIISCIIYFFYSQLKATCFTKNIDFKTIFSLPIFIYIIYKVIRYSEFGNDALPALMTFYLISKVLEKDFVKKNFKFIYLFVVFIFLNKTTMIFLFLIPFLLFFLNKNYLNIKEYFKITFSFPSFILVLWFFKNFLISSCLIYPIYSTCLNTEWSNIEETKKISIESEAWAKAWPENKKKISYSNYNKSFNWLQAWSKKHLFYILKIILPFITILFLIAFFVFMKRNDKNLNHSENLVPLYVSLIGCLAFFLKFPLYRYGYGYIISFISLIFTYLIHKNLDEFKFIKIVKIILIISPFIFFGKQISRAHENLENKSIWPAIEANTIDKKNTLSLALKNKGLTIYKSSNYCYYTKKICTQMDLGNFIKIDKFKKYFVVKKLKN